MSSSVLELPQLGVGSHTFQAFGSLWSTSAYAMRVFLLDPEVLLEHRHRLQVPALPGAVGADGATDAAGLAAPLAALLQEADQKLSAGPFSVTSKETPPPSGDLGRRNDCFLLFLQCLVLFGHDVVSQLEPLSQHGSKLLWSKKGDVHDYCSLGRYWWPDPSKPDGLPYIRKDGQPNPDRGKVGDNGRFGAMLKAVITLSYAWFFTQREEYASRAAKLLRVWFLDPKKRMNPHLRDSV